MGGRRVKHSRPATVTYDELERELTGKIGILHKLRYSVDREFQNFLMYANLSRDPSMTRKQPLDQLWNNVLHVDKQCEILRAIQTLLEGDDND